VRSLRPFLFTLAMALVPLCSLAVKGPLVQVSSRTIDFGQTDQQQLLHRDLFIENGGDQPLVIFKIESSCGCTGVILADSIIAPGARARVDVSFSTRDYQGPQEKYLQIQTNDPAERIVKIAVKADVIPLIEISSDRVRFDSVRRGQTPEQKVRLAAKVGFGLAVKKIEGGEEWFTTSVQTDKADGKEVCNVLLKLKPTAPAGPFRKIVSVHCAGAIPRVIDLAVGGQVVSYFETDGDARVNFPITEKGITSGAAIRITCDGSKSYRLASVESTLEFITGEIVPDGPNAYRLKLTLLPTAPAGAYRGLVKINTTDPAQPVINVGVQGLVRG
jgi:hypothetical protein